MSTPVVTSCRRSRPLVLGASGRTALGPVANAATALTVGYGVLVFYLALLVINFAAAGLVIPPDYLAETIGHSAGWTEYLRVAVMATGLGTIAGAVGSGLEDDETVRRAACSTREQERRRRVRACTATALRRVVRG